MALTQDLPKLTDGEFINFKHIYLEALCELEALLLS